MNTIPQKAKNWKSSRTWRDTWPSQRTSTCERPFTCESNYPVYVLLLLCIIVSYILFGIMCLISGRFYPLGLQQPLGFLHPSPNLFCSFAIVRVCILLSIWMTSWSLFALSGQVRGQTCFVFLVGLSWFTHQFFEVWPLPLSDLLFLGVMLGYCPHVSIFASW